MNPKSVEEALDRMQANVQELQTQAAGKAVQKMALTKAPQLQDPIIYVNDDENSLTPAPQDAAVVSSPPTLMAKTRPLRSAAGTGSKVAPVMSWTPPVMSRPGTSRGPAGTG